MSSATDWIKMRTGLGTCPQVVRIASGLNAEGCPLPVRVHIAIGALHATWSLADRHTEDGTLPGYTPEMLDDVVRLEGWTDLLASVGWIAVNPAGITFPDFSDHNGASAKRRANDAKRKSSVRKPSAESPQSVRIASGQNAELEKEEEKEKDSLPSVEKGARARAGSASALEKALRVEPGLPDHVVAAAHRWVAYRKDAKLRAWAAATWASNLAKARTDPDRWVAAVAQAIDCGWMGVFPEKVTGAAVSDPKGSAAPKPFAQLDDEYRRKRAAQTVADAGADDGIRLDADGRPIAPPPGQVNGARPRLLGEGA